MASLYASSASFVAIPPAFRQIRGQKASSASRASSGKLSFQRASALRASQSAAVEQPILGSFSPLSMNIDELAAVRFGPRSTETQ